MRLEPPVEVLNADFMFNRWVLDNNRYGRLAASDVIDPIVLAKYAKPLSHCLVQGIRSRVDGMLAAAQIGTRDTAPTKSHNLRMIAASLLLRHADESPKETNLRRESI